MVSLLAVSYLFLGGAGAGVLVVASLIDLTWLKEPFGGSSRVSIDEARPSERVVAFSFLGGLLALVLGVLCLVFDLGRIDRLVDLFLAPSLSFLTLGAYALGVLLVCSSLLVVVRFAYIPSIPRALVVGVEICAVVLGVFAMVYTGLLLQNIGGVAFWHSPGVPVLFVLSSLSCGIALVLLAGVFDDEDVQISYLVRRLVRIDMVILVLEGVVAGAFVAVALGDAHSTTVSSAQQLFQGSFGVLWWGGFVVVGLVVPLAIEVARDRSGSPLHILLAVAAVFVLVGGFSMRSAIVGVGEHRDLVLEEPLSLPLDHRSSRSDLT